MELTNEHNEKDENEYISDYDYDLDEDEDENNE